MVTKPISADDECDLYGIQMVKLQDPQLAKRYGIKTFPSLVYFRNGNPLTYDGRHIPHWINFSNLMCTNNDAIVL